MLASSRQSKVKLELVRAAAMTGYFDVAQELKLDVGPLLRKIGFTSTMLSAPE
jgi:hypothetical protein